MDIRPYVIDSQGIDWFSEDNSFLTMGHSGDFVKLKGPAVFEVELHHYWDSQGETLPRKTIVVEKDKTVVITNPEGQPEYEGNWDTYVFFTDVPWSTTQKLLVVTGVMGIFALFLSRLKKR